MQSQNFQCFRGNLCWVLFWYVQKLDLKMDKKAFEIFSCDYRILFHNGRMASTVKIKKREYCLGFVRKKNVRREGHGLLLGEGVFDMEERFLELGFKALTTTSNKSTIIINEKILRSCSMFILELTHVKNN